ncbi:MAG: MBL fold metallo-hydrolase [Verrucomicrobia bacterium]|nr:MBL fold metallo-hydrolase [Verrucomicrobiota bacterium]
MKSTPRCSNEISLTEIFKHARPTPLLCLLVVGLAYSAVAQQPPQWLKFQPLANQEVYLSMRASTGQAFDIQISSDLKQWDTWRTVSPADSEYFSFLAATNQLFAFTDPFTRLVQHRFYRAALADTNALTGDHLATAQGDVVIHPIHHGTFVMSWAGKMIYADPTGGAIAFQGLPPADLLLITHIHPDHFDTNTLQAVKGPSTRIFAPQNVFDAMPGSLKSITTVMPNGATASPTGILIEAVAMYNTTPGRLNFHPRGLGNGYILTIGGKRIYISGDTEDIPEMRALKNIDVAFLSMNPPFTMDVRQAVSAVREFKPRVVYPYHYRGVKMGPTGPDFTQPVTQDIDLFKELVGTELGIEVRLRHSWYTKLEVGDRLETDQGDLIIHPIHHSSVAMEWAGKTIYFDPTGGSAGVQGYPAADLILISHIHGDHFNTNSLAALKGPNTIILAPPTVVAVMPGSLREIAFEMTNGATANLFGLSVEVVPSYNTTPGRPFHPKGVGNGYVLTLGGKRVYHAGDTEDIPEMRALKNIDVAFVPMNPPFTMDVNRAANAVREFKPRVVYPNHSIAPPLLGGILDGAAQDVSRFKQLVGTDLGIEVRWRRWYVDY